MKDTIRYIKSDLNRRFMRKKHKFFVCLLYFSLDSSTRFLVNFRLAQSKNMLFSILGRIYCKFSPTRKLIQIPYETKIGYGLLLPHGGPVVINKSAVIGKNCNISQFVTIGSMNYDAATIGDNVYIGPNTCIVENVKIGDNVTIGAGSVVTKDIPDNATAVGNYAKVINYNNPGKFIYNKYLGEK